METFDHKSRVRRVRRKTNFLYVRVVGRTRYQARVWLAWPVGSVNLGCYATEAEAWAVVRTWIAAGACPTAALPGGILPKWVRRESGRFYSRHRAKKSIVELGPFRTAVAAHSAMVKHLRQQ